MLLAGQGRDGRRPSLPETHPPLHSRHARPVVLLRQPHRLHYLRTDCQLVLGELRTQRQRSQGGLLKEGGLLRGAGLLKGVGLLKGAADAVLCVGEAVPGRIAEEGVLSKVSAERTRERTDLRVGFCGGLDWRARMTAEGTGLLN